MFLYHYFDKRDGPFMNLSYVSHAEAIKVLEDIKENRPSSQSASRDDQYMKRRENYEKIAYDFFVSIGGKPEQKSPYFMCVEECEWLYTWYEQPDFVKIPIEEFDLKTISFSYGDMHPTFSPIVTDGLEYRKKLYMYNDILNIIDKYGIPQRNEYKDEIGFPRYVEAQIWSDTVVNKYIEEYFNERKN